MWSQIFKKKQQEAFAVPDRGFDDNRAYLHYPTLVPLPQSAWNEQHPPLDDSPALYAARRDLILTLTAALQLRKTLTATFAQLAFRSGGRKQQGMDP